MKLAFVSCYLSIHQVPLCEEFYNYYGEEFCYISVDKVPDWRIRNGYTDLDSEYPFVIKAYEDEPRAMEKALNSDVVIIGSAPDKYIKQRLKDNKLTFRYSERFYKEGIRLHNFVRTMASTWIHHGRYKNKPLYMLCASAYTAVDCRRFGNYKNKLFKWGYFPKLYEYDIESLIQGKKKNVTNLVWIGRLIEWKHPESAIRVAEYLKNNGIEFSLTLIGTGNQEEALKRMISKNNLERYIKLVGAVPSHKVRDYLEKADIFLFTSDYKEGWGAVLNEAMNSACAVVACSAAGSVPYLVKDQYNGLIYDLEDQEKLNRNVRMLIENSELRIQLGCNAYKTIKNTWNEKVAAERFISLINNIEGGDNPFENGPCSNA